MKTEKPNKLFLLLSFTGSLTLVMAGTAIIFTTTPSPLWIICGSMMTFCGWVISLAIADYSLNTSLIAAGGYMFLLVGSLFMITTFTAWASSLLVLSMLTICVLPMLAQDKS